MLKLVFVKKKNWLLSFVFLVLVVSLIKCTASQSQSTQVYSVENFKLNKNTPSKGVSITSKGKLKALFIFVMFKDDTLTKSTGWEYNTKALPNWATSIVNPSSDKRFPKTNLTHYFYEMSQGNFLLYGDVYPKIVIPDLAENKYKSIAQVNFEILKKLDGEIDYSQYDNWKRTKNGKFVEGNDGTVDMIFLVYRNFSNKLFYNQGWTGSAHFYLTKNIETNDGVTIKTGRLHNGSGIQQRAGKHGYEYSKYISAHEFAHFLFGGGHTRNISHLGLLNAGPVWNESRGMHSWEREKLGWINYKDILLDNNSSLTLDDYITTGDAARIKLSKDEWFLIENHQKVSPHDWAKDKGIYIFRIKNATRFPPTITTQCADGNWDFVIDKKNKKLIKTIPNRNGKNETNFSKRNGSTNFACYEGVYEDNSVWGDEFDAFDLTYNNIFSPVSNPSSKNKANKDFVIEVKEKIGNKYLLDISFVDIYKNTPPAKPQIVGLENVKSKTPTLNWLPNEEPDLMGYSLTQISPSKKYLGDVKKSTNEFLIKSLVKNKNVENLISITAKDLDENNSVSSNLIIIKWNNTKKEWNYSLLERN